MKQNENIFAAIEFPKTSNLKFIALNLTMEERNSSGQYFILLKLKTYLNSVQLNTC